MTPSKSPHTLADIRYCAPSALHPDPKNARKHNKRQLDLLAKSIETFGFNVPVLVDADDNILAGHARVQAATKLGLQSVPTIRLDHLTPDQVRAFRLADNRLTEIASWDDQLLAENLKLLTEVDLDFDIEAAGFSIGEIDLRIEGLDGSVSDVADDVPEPDTVAVTQLGDLWQLGEHRILCGNALEASTYALLMEDICGVIR